MAYSNVVSTSRKHKTYLCNINAIYSASCRNVGIKSTFFLHVFPVVLAGLSLSPGATAVREIFEETGVHSEFKSLLSIRQQHNHPGAFGMSDLYIICRLSPLTYHIDFCPLECLRCEWLQLEELAKTSETTPITSRVARLLLYGLERGFENIDLTMEEMPAVYSGMFYQLYHRPLPNSKA